MGLLVGGIECANFLNAMKGQVGIHVGDLGHSGDNECGVAPGGVDGRGLGKFFGEGGKNFPDQSPIADDGADLHGVFGGFANGAGGLRQVDAGEQGGALMKVIAKRSETRGDDPAQIGAAGSCRDNVEGDRGAKVDHNGGLLQRSDGGGVGETVGSDLVGLRVVDRDGEFALMADLMGRDARDRERLGEKGCFRGNNGTDRCAG